ncbi:MAG: efflux transporter, family, subunit [Gemmataceae bacterium]|nr:efflux transporter, family, subunit [Gemmataceae bacterium]
MRLLRFGKPVLGVAVLVGVVTGGYLSRDAWMPWLRPSGLAMPAPTGEAGTPPAKVLLTDQAIANLELTARPLTAGPYWKTILIPGRVVDRPGVSDRGVVTPATGVVTAITRVPGEAVRTGETLFTIRVLSDTLHATQSELFKATREVSALAEKRDRLAKLVQSGTESQTSVIEAQLQLRRLDSAVQSYRQELLTRGLTPDQIDAVTEGTFVKEIRVAAPARPAGQTSPAPSPAGSSSGPPPDPPPAYEVQELKVELGQQVLAGQMLCLLANHQKLAVEGRAFPDETPLLERAVKEGWPVEVDLGEPPGSDWPTGDHALPITHLSNFIDPANRTFAFLMPLENESRVVERDGRTQRLWRFRPGQKVRLHVRVEKLENVFVLPAGAVARDGPEAFVFTQNVNTFERRPVRVLVTDRDRVVIANDGALPPGVFVAQSAAAQLNRMAKSQSNSVPKGYHVHADGSLHKNEDEGK